MTVPTFARILGHLDQRNLIEKEVGSSDARKRKLTLSDTGVTLTTQLAIVLRA